MEWFDLQDGEMNRLEDARARYNAVTSQIRMAQEHGEGADISAHVVAGELARIIVSLEIEEARTR